jgi:uncharacterized protein YndB with AHSA1/START domain
VKDIIKGRQTNLISKLTIRLHLSLIVVFNPVNDAIHQIVFTDHTLCLYQQNETLMETTRTSITVQTTVEAPLEKVWNAWTKPEHITQWNNASDDWHTPKASNDLRVGGKFSATMAARDGSASFDFEGIYSNVKPNQLIEYAMSDGRTVKVVFEAAGTKTRVIETFDAENENPIEMQRGGWQAILDNFKKYTESL